MSRCPVKVKQLARLCGLHARSQKYTKGGDFRPAFIRVFTMTYRLTGHPRKEKWIVGAPEEMGPATRTAEVISQGRRRNWSALNQCTYTNKYQYARQSLNKAKPLEKTVQKNVTCSILFRRNIINVIGGNRNFKRRIPYPTIMLISLCFPNSNPRATLREL